MTAAALVETLRARGVTLEPRGDRLRVRPASAVTPDEVEALRRYKPEVLRLLTGGSRPARAARPAPDLAVVRRVVAMPLDRFAHEGCPLEVCAPWLEGTLWFVPTPTDAKALIREGVSRGRIWTAGELMDLLTIPGLTTDQAKTIARAKLEFSGEVVEVRPRREAG